MDDSMKRMEARLESLMPKGISDCGRERLEETIDELAATTPVAGNSSWKWAVGAAACLGLAAGLGLLRGPEEVGPVVEVPTVPVEGVVLAVYEPVVETLASSLQVDGRFDEGWAVVEGDGVPHRYWGYELTDEEEVVDEESGYTVRIYSEREEWVPVKLTSL